MENILLAAGLALAVAFGGFVIRTYLANPRYILRKLFRHPWSMVRIAWMYLSRTWRAAWRG